MPEHDAPISGKAFWYNLINIACVRNKLNSTLPKFSESEKKIMRQYIHVYTCTWINWNSSGSFQTLRDEFVQLISK